MQLVKNLIPEGSVCDTGKHFVDHKATNITIHYTGPLPKQTPEEVRKYWIDSKGEPSAHFIIKDDECLQCWEIDKIAWHTGTKAGNHCSIGIEVIPEDKQGKFSEKSIQTLKELLQTLPHLPIVRHYDWNAKKCPAYYVIDSRWKALLEQIKPE